MDAYICSNLLVATLTSRRLMKKTTKDFMLINENSQKVQLAENLLKEHNLLPDYDQFKLRKSNETAEEFIDMGNWCYKNNKYYEALVNYNKCLCYAPKNSQNVGKGFANRSAVYYEMGQYEKCLENIELAKNHNYPKEKIEKLNKREELALEKLNNGPDPNQKLMKYEAARERFLKPKLKAKENLNFYVADCLEVKMSPEFGRYLITNEDLKVGTVIAVERPFSKIVDPETIYEACDFCARKNLLNLLPCFNCCSAMFCSEDCHNAAQEKSHKYECGLVKAIDQFFSKPARLALRTYFEALNVCETPSKLRELLSSIKDSNATILDFDYTDEASFRKNSLHSVDTLMTVEKSQYCDFDDLFQRSVVCAVMSNLMLNHSETMKALLVDDADKNLFREFIFKYTQISSLNSISMYHTTPANNNASDQIGSAFFPFCSLINHSCAANVLRETLETTSYIMVNRPIKKGEQLFDNYGYHHTMAPRQFRQAGLLKQYRFKCNCEACQKDYPLRPMVKNPSQHTPLMMDYVPLVMMHNFDEAVKDFDKFCKLIDKLDGKDYPTSEIILSQHLMLTCLRMFLINETY